MKKVVIIGGGITGLSVAYRLKKDFGVLATVLESDTRPGGKAQTNTSAGFTTEEATNGWLDKEPHMRELIAELKLTEQIQPSDDLASHRFIYRAGKLRELQMHPVKFMTSSALPLGARLRLCMEPLIKPYAKSEDETLADFAARRLGKGARDLLISPMAFGVYAGDPSRMSLKSCFKKVHDLEQNHGGLIKGMIALKKEKKNAGENPAEVQAGPSGRLTSFKDGMGVLTGALAQVIGENLRCDQRVHAIKKTENNTFIIEIENAPPLEADAVISAAPAYAAAAFLSPLDPDAAAAFGEIPYPALDVVCLGYHKSQIKRDLDGFGFLVPRGQKKTLLGALWTSSIFPGRAPDDHVLIRAMIGGMLESQVATWDREQVVQTVLKDLKDILGIKAEIPVFQKVFRHEKAIPQYHVGHRLLKERITAAEKRHPGFFVTGNALKGIGVIDCVRESTPLAKRVAQYLNESQDGWGRLGLETRPLSRRIF